MSSDAALRQTAAFEDQLRQDLPFLDDEDLTDVMLNDDGRLWIKRWGKSPELVRTDFPSARAETLLRLAAGAANTEITFKNPRLSAELPNGARLQGFLPPVTTRPVIVLRTHREVRVSLQDYVTNGYMTADQAAEIRENIAQRKNIVIAGATGSGKTTLANAMLLELKDSHDRIVVLEDTRELQCAAPNTVRLRSSLAISLRELVFDTLRIKPDRIVVGEVRKGSVARELLAAWSTGHPGGITTLHADSAGDVMVRVEQLLMEEFPVVPYHLISRAIDAVYFLATTPNGPRLTTMEPDAMEDLKER
ncbi:ATPase, T2SS/T4P/T4SS family [Nisaea sediminum]|uniref:ATPase, T2SS/T4P/T4SS family n=1 Tax=Nisaea sediminum TaxID=2775867 RepID=UPI0018667BE8|nr:ATPase, T2SS/T4P/T4SS family [Nisaea sediminum]